MRKKYTSLFLFLVLTMNFLIFIPNTTIAEQEGDYYVCNFEKYAVGDQWLNESIEGVKWLEVKTDSNSNNQVDNTYTKTFLTEPNDANVYDTFFNFSTQFTFMNFSSPYNLGSSNTGLLIGFYNDADDLMFYWSSKNGQMDLYDSIDGKLYDGVLTSTTSCSFDIQYNVSSGVYYTVFNNHGTSAIYDKEYAHNNIDYISYMKITATTPLPTYIQFHVDNIKILVGDTPLPWTLEYDSYGSVTSDYDVSTHFQNPTLNSVVEEKRDGITETLLIKQFAISLLDTTDIANFDISLYFSDLSMGEYDNSYTYDDYYVLVWNDIDESLTNGIFELNFIDTVGSSNLLVPESYTDIDGDEDTEYRYGAGELIDGDYNAPVHETVDIIYQFWYTASETYGEDSIFLNVYDKETGDLLRVFGKFANTAFLAGYDPAISTNIYSSLYSGDYDYYGDFGSTVELENFNISDSGEWHFINLTTITGVVGSESKVYYDSTNYLKIYPGQTYDILIIPDDYTGNPDFTNCNNADWGIPFISSWKPIFCTDKYAYDYGETVLFGYKLPPTSWMHSVPGYPVTGYRIEIQDIDGWFPDVLHNFYQSQGHFSFTGTWMENLNWVADDTTGHSQSYKAYSAKLEHDSWFNPSIWINYVCTGDDFSPAGEIVSISPSDPYLGQSVSVLFTANNTGKMELKHLASGEILDYMTFTKFTGARTASFMPDRPGTYLVSLFVNGYAGQELVDTDSFDLNGTGGVQGDYGYNVEYLEIPEYIVIAGYDNVTIYYNTFENNTVLEIKTPRGETSIYSSNLSDGWGAYIIDTPSSMSIGTWNVTMYAEKTLHTSFNIIAQEGNWVEFLQNIYYDDELFTLHVKHTKRVVLVFYKNGVPQGTDFRMEKDWMVNNNVIIPSENIIPTPGSWTVEMWQVNDWVREKLLATWDCKVISRSGEGITEGGYDDIFSILTEGSSSIASGGFGLAFMAIIFILVVVVSMAQMKLKNDTIFFGAILMALFMVYIGWLPVWIVVISIIIAGFLFSSAFTKKLGIGG